MPGNPARPVRRGAVRKRTRNQRTPRHTAYPTACALFLKGGPSGALERMSAALNLLAGGGSAVGGRHQVSRRRYRPIRVSQAHPGRVEVQLSGTGVVPHEMEGSGGRGDALVVTDVPGAVLAAGGLAVLGVEGPCGHPVGCAEAE